jgi:excisionase family DNA binding protein
MTDEVIAFTIPGAVKASGLTRTRIYNLIGDGSIEAVKAGRRTLVKAQSLRHYVDTLPAATIKRAKAA